MMQEGPLLVALTTLTALSEQDWRDVLALPPDGQELVLQAYKNADWVRRPDTLTAVIAVLETLGTIAGVVGGVAGAASAVVVLKNL